MGVGVAGEAATPRRAQGTRSQGQWRKPPLPQGPTARRQPMARWETQRAGYLARQLADMPPLPPKGKLRHTRRDARAPRETAPEGEGKRLVAVGSLPNSPQERTPEKISAHRPQLPERGRQLQPQTLAGTPARYPRHLVQGATLAAVERAAKKSCRRSSPKTCRVVTRSCPPITRMGTESRVRSVESSGGRK